MSRIILALSCLFLFSSCADILRALEESSQQPQGQTQESPQSQTKTVQTFEQMDANSDGRLSNTEAQGTVKESFTKLDSNKDGYLTKAEVEGTSSSTRTDKRPTKN